MSGDQEPVTLDVAPTLLDNAELRAQELPDTQDLEDPTRIDRRITEETRELAVAEPVVVVQDQAIPLKRRIYWLTVALSASLAAHLGGLVGAHLLPPLADWVRADELIYQRVAKSSRSIAARRLLRGPVSPTIEQLQRDAERAAFAGDAEQAAQKLQQLDRSLERRVR